MAPSKKSLLERLVDHGYGVSEREARGLIMGGKVYVDDSLVTKPGTKIAVDARVRVKGERKRYASRGGLKLEHALSYFNLSVSGMSCLDAGASAGGFTDCLLRNAASVVYAVDVGFGQFGSALAQNRRVVVMEKTNIADLRPDSFEAPIEFCTVDLSYLSLSKAIPMLEPVLAAQASMVCLIKPMYEGLKQHEARSLSALEQVLGDAIQAINAVAERAVTGVTCSPVLGGRQAVEFLVYLKPNAEELPQERQSLAASMQGAATLLSSPR